MKTVLAISIAILVAGCAKPSATTADSGPGVQDELSKKLQAMPADQRAEYVKNHMDEVTAAGRKAAGPSTTGQ